MLLEALSRRPVQRLIVASSMSVYGEGLYITEDGRHADARPRSLIDVRRGQWEPRDETGAPLTPFPPPESKTPTLESVYALGKYDQERLCLMLGRACGIPTIALRFLNVYGPRQALSNPYTGVLAIFAARLINGRAARIFEDGLQQRDFVNVADVAHACVLALDHPDVSDTAITIGGVRTRTVREIAQHLAESLGSDIAPEITGQYRAGDIRHCFADIARAPDRRAGVQHRRRAIARRQPPRAPGAAATDLRQPHHRAPRRVADGRPPLLRVRHAALPDGHRVAAHRRPRPGVQRLASWTMESGRLVTSQRMTA